SGLGAATADAAYGLIAAFGLTAISGALVAQKFWLGVLGGLFLLYLGARTLLAKPAEQAAASSRNGLAGAYLSTLVLTLTNPMTILSFVAIFAGLGLASEADYGAASVLVVGVFFGSALWWLGLSIVVGWLRTRFNPQALVWVNRLSGLIIIAFGLFSLWSAWSL
ncbi:MAG: LysE family transporter, partial [Anaerolineales bacterium]|nr:LysE family transporter [Anaerolineales bacterium]